LHLWRNLLKVLAFFNSSFQTNIPSISIWLKSKRRIALNALNVAIRNIAGSEIRLTLSHGLGLLWPSSDQEIPDAQLFDYMDRKLGLFMPLFGEEFPSARRSVILPWCANES